MKLLFIVSILMNFTSTAKAGMESSLKVYKKYLEKKVAKDKVVESFNKNLYLSYPVRDVELIDRGDLVEVHWFLETDNIRKTVKLAKSKYKKPYSEKRLVKTLEALQSFKKVSRAIASIPQQEHKLASRSYDNKKPSVNVGTQFGQVAITNSDKKLNFNLAKVSGSYRVKWGDGYSFGVSVGVVRFLDIVYSEGANSDSFDSNVYEYGLDFVKNFGKFSMGLNLGSLNYVILSDETTTDYVFEPQRISRGSGRLSYSLNNETSLSGGAGIINGTGLSGFDYFVGVGYHFGDQGEYSISPSLYSSSINIQNGGTDVSTAMTFSFSVNLD